MFGVAGCGVMIGMALLPLNIPLPACVLWFLQGLGSVGVLAAYEALSRYRKELWFGPEPKQPKNYVQE
jgi:hypothetical protein